MAKDCGCGVMQASGDPHGRSISTLQGLGKIKKHGRKAPRGGLDCSWEGKKKRTWVCRDDRGRIVKKKKKARGKR